MKLLGMAGDHEIVVDKIKETIGWKSMYDVLISIVITTFEWEKKL